jgi:hypothetical protein
MREYYVVILDTSEMQNMCGSEHTNAPFAELCYGSACSVISVFRHISRYEMHRTRPISSHLYVFDPCHIATRYRVEVSHMEVYEYWRALR